MKKKILAYAGNKKVLRPTGEESAEVVAGLHHGPVPGDVGHGTERVEHLQANTQHLFFIYKQKQKNNIELRASNT